MPYGRGPGWVPYTRPAGGWLGRWMPRQVLHAPAPAETYNRHVRAQLDMSAAVVLNSSGAGFTQLAPDGMAWWEVRQCRVRTTTGPVDSSQAMIYQTAIVDHRQIAETAQGGGDSMSFAMHLRPGDTIIALWSGGNPGDTATMTIYGVVHARVPG